MGEAILGVIVLALLAFHSRQARAWAEERRYLMNLSKASNPAEFNVLQHASKPLVPEALPGLIGATKKKPTPPSIAPLGL